VVEDINGQAKEVAGEQDGRSLSAMAKPRSRFSTSGIVDRQRVKLSGRTRRSLPGFYVRNLLVLVSGDPSPQ
jgi:hypothetical protein